MMNRNNERYGAIKNLVISLKLHVFHSPAISGNTGNSVYENSGEYRAHVIETEYLKATALAQSKMLHINR
jgi:hypothetical protein